MSQKWSGSADDDDKLRKLALPVVLLVVVSAAAVIAGRAWLMRRPEPPPARPESAGSGVRQIAPIVAEGDPGPESASSQAILQNVATVVLTASTPEDLLRKGFPLMSAPRKAAYERTVNQTTAELAADLGNSFTISYCSPSHNIAAGPAMIEYYAYRVSHHIKVLRLIEEGRPDPDPTASVLHEVVAEIIKGYPAVLKAHQEASLRLDLANPPSISENDEYYQRNFRYENPLFELGREVTTVYSAFYVLANIERLDPALLAEWIRLKRSRWGECKDMDVWLADAYYRAAEPGPYRDKHFALVKDMSEFGRTVQRSAWNALWNTDEMLFQAARVDPSGIRTIEILEIPRMMPLTMTKTTKDAILANFLENVDANAR